MALKTRRWQRGGGAALEFTELGFGTAPLGNLYRAIGDDDARAILERAWAGGVRYYDTAPPLRARALRAPARHPPPRQAPGRVRPVHQGRPPSRALRPGGAGRPRKVVRSAIAPRGLRLQLRRDHAQLRVLARADGGRPSGRPPRARHRRPEPGIEGRVGRPDRPIHGLRLPRHGVAPRPGGGEGHRRRGERVGTSARPSRRAATSISSSSPGGTPSSSRKPSGASCPSANRGGSGSSSAGPTTPASSRADQSPVRSTTMSPPPKESSIGSVGLPRSARRHGVPLVEAAFQFPLLHPCIVSVIPGGQRVAEVESNLSAAAASIPPALWDDLKAAGLMRPDAPTG